ncbi:MAG: DNA-directed RNA polymerase subunit alpha [Candidatus Levyibacteriota bacterium]
MINPKFKVVEEDAKDNYTRFVFEPLEPGFGNTLGVALRRVLLTGIEGSAVTSVKINGVKHMFSTLPGLKEDIIELILNIKMLRVQMSDAKKEGKLTLEITGPGRITGGDIEVTDGIEIVNKDHYLGSLADKKSKIEMEMTVEKGLGYSLAEERKISTIGVIPIDAIFSPVVKVNYKVEQTRVGRQTNYDKLNLDVWTDGTINPSLVLEQAARILVAYFMRVYEQDDEVITEQISTSSKLSDESMKMTVDELDLPTRIYNSLRNAGIETVGQLLTTPKKELMNYRNLGAKSLSVIEESLKEKGIEFNI